MTLKHLMERVGGRRGWVGAGTGSGTAERVGGGLCSLRLGGLGFPEEPEWGQGGHKVHSEGDTDTGANRWQQNKDTQRRRESKYMNINASVGDHH